jgi:hypothetical protein
MSERMSAAQMQGIEGRIRQAVEQTIEAMKLRKLAMEMAIQSQGGAGADYVEAAERIYAFLTAPTSEVRVSLDG